VRSRLRIFLPRGVSRTRPATTAQGLPLATWIRSTWPHSWSWLRSALSQDPTAENGLDSYSTCGKVVKIVASDATAVNARRQSTSAVDLGLLAIIIVMIVLGAGVSATPAAVGLVSPETKLKGTADKLIVVHALRSRTGARIAAWSAASGQIAIAFEGSTDVAIVEGRELTYWSEGRRSEVIRYHYQGLWRGLLVRFGITEAMVRHALSLKANVRRVASPLARHPAGAMDEPPSVLTTVDDYGDNVGALARNTPFPIRHAGPALLGYQLARSYIARVNNPFRGGMVSGPIATFIYSTDPTRLGADAHRLTLNFTARASQAGDVTPTVIGGGRPSVRAGGIVGYKANRNQIVFELGPTIGVVTSTLLLADSQWKRLLSSLRAP
jgi:hypothetical protein